MHSGGEGLIKSWTALEKVMVSLLTERRLLSPYGLRSEDGGVGENILETDGELETLPAKTTLELGTGETLILKTPGGGGWNPRD
jgi:N-methylhydantoinase B/oxoprolinase/acetone carboxylase alpha subunit